MDIKTAAPMRALKYLKYQYPDVFSMIDQCVEDKDPKMVNYWDHGLVYAPVALARAAMEESVQDPTALLKAPLDLSLIAAVAAWRKSKTIYDFAPDLSKELVATAKRKNLEIPIGSIALPYWAVYIRPNMAEWDVDGFFVCYDEDINENTKLHYHEIRFIPIDRQGRPRATLYLITNPDGIGDMEETTIADCLENNMKTHENLDEPRNEKLYGEEMIKITGGKFPADAAHAGFQEMGRLAAEWISLVIYISAVNAEIRPDAQHYFKRTKAVKDIPREIEYLHVGEKAGMRIRALQNTVVQAGRQDSLGGHHRPPVMHIRRAHWHSFRIGKGRKGLKVKWLPPIVVNAGGEEIDLLTINKVQKENN